MKYLSAIFLFVLINKFVEAQDSTRFVVKAGQTIQEVLKPGVLYRYPQFLQVMQIPLSYFFLFTHIHFYAWR